MLFQLLKIVTLFLLFPPSQQQEQQQCASTALSRLEQLQFSIELDEKEVSITFTALKPLYLQVDDMLTELSFPQKGRGDVQSEFVQRMEESIHDHMIELLNKSIEINGMTAYDALTQGLEVSKVASDKATSNKVTSDKATTRKRG